MSRTVMKRVPKRRPAWVVWIHVRPSEEESAHLAKQAAAWSAALEAVNGERDRHGRRFTPHEEVMAGFERDLRMKVGSTRAERRTWRRRCSRARHTKNIARTLIPGAFGQARIEVVASQIEPTSPITGDDADRLLEQLADVAPPEEIERRKEEARRFLAEVTAPKYPRPLPAKKALAKKLPSDLNADTRLIEPPWHRRAGVLQERHGRPFVAVWLKDDAPVVDDVDALKSEMLQALDEAWDAGLALDEVEPRLREKYAHVWLGATPSLIEARPNDCPVLVRAADRLDEALTRHGLQVDREALQERLRRSS